MENKQYYTEKEIYHFADSKNLSVTDCTDSSAIDPDDAESRPEFTLDDQQGEGEPIYGFVYTGTFDEFQEDENPLFKKVKY